MPKRKGPQINIYKQGEYQYSRPLRKRAVDVFAGPGSVAGKFKTRRDKVEGSTTAGEYQNTRTRVYRDGTNKPVDYTRGHYKRGGS